MNAHYLQHPPNQEIREVYTWERYRPEHLAPHYHEHIEIMQMTQGELKITVDYKEYTLHKGDTVILFPNQIHRFFDISGQSLAILFIFKAALCPNYRQIFDTKRPEYPIIKDADKIPGVTENMKLILKECKERQKYCDNITSGAIQSLLGLLLRQCPLSDRGSMDETTAERILGYCYENFTGDITLTGTAEALGLSPYYLSHLIPRKYGMHFGELIAALRLEEAIRLIQEGNKISAAALYAGFPAVRAFNRAFLKQYGMPPSEYLHLKD